MLPEEALLLLKCHVDISDEIFSRLFAYHDLLLKWQAKVNLIGSDTIEDIWNRHFLDSLQLLKLLPSTSKPILDLGSGAGFPGMVLAIAGIKNIHLVESDSKKTSFLKEVARITKTDVIIDNIRIEDMNLSDAGVVMARALADLPTLFEYIERFVSHETIYLFPKGKNYAKELQDAKLKWNFDAVAIPSVTDINAVILSISNLRRRVV